MRCSRLVAALGASVLVVGVASCSVTGGKPRSSDGGMGAGSADTPRMTVAMITHEAPGDSFWDLVRKGAETAAKKDNFELRYSSDPEGPNQANLVQIAVDSGVKGIAVTLAKPDAMKAGVEAAIAKNIPVVALNSGSEAWQAMGVKEYFGQDEYIAGQEAGKRLTSEGAKKAICVIQEQGHVGLEARCAGVKNTFAASEVLNVNGKDMPSVESTITAKLQQDPSIDTVLTLGAPFALTAVQSAKNAGSKCQDRHLRYQRRAGRGHQERQRAVGRRPATVPTGLPGHRLAVALPQQRQRHRRQPADVDRALIHRQLEHRRCRRIREGWHPMSTQADLDLATHKVVHDERVKEQNRLQRLIVRPEMGALVGAVGIFIFFFIVAPPFRSPESLATVLYASSTIGIMAVGVGLLMIGGEFDLSSGVAVTTSSLAASMLSYNLHLNLWAGALLALVVSLAIGFFNGYMVMKTKIPSFLITLGTFLMLTGINLAVTKLIAGQVATPSVSDMQGFESGKAFFSSSIPLGAVSLRITVVWWICSPCSPPTSCSRPVSGTGSSRSAVIRTVPARWVSR